MQLLQMNICNSLKATECQSRTDVTDLNPYYRTLRYERMGRINQI